MIRKIFRIPLAINIAIGLVFGILAGFILLKTGYSVFTEKWIVPFGTIFLNLLKLLAVPIVFLSVCCGIFGIGSIQVFRKLAGKTLLLYIGTTLFAIFIGLILVKMIRPGELYKGMQTDVVIDLQARSESAETLEKQGFMQIIVDIVPENLFSAMTDNSKMLQIIFVSILLGLMILVLPYEQTDVVRKFLLQLNDIFIKLIDWAMKIAPLGVFALMAGMVVSFGGNLDVLKALGLYALTVILGLFLLMFFFYPVIITFFTKYKYLQFLKAIYPAQLVAFTTSSSAATFPVTKRQVEKELHVPEKISGFVLPLGMTINMDGTSLYQVVAVFFIAQVFGIELTLIQQFVIILTALLSSIGAPGIPGGSIVMLILILSSVGIPPEGVALILSIDRPLDMFRTSTNVTGDAMICCIQNATNKYK